MEQRVTTYSQHSTSSNVNGIKDIEAKTVNGIPVEKIYFQPDVNLDLAISQIVAATDSIRALMPTGIQPPVIAQYSASAVGSDRLGESQLYEWDLPVAADEYSRAADRASGIGADRACLRDDLQSERNTGGGCRRWCRAFAQDRYYDG